MGLREKADYNLQTVSLACAVVVILVLCAARQYTSDWRERRLFKRQLAKTQKKLLHASEDNHEQELLRRRRRHIIAHNDYESTSAIDSEDSGDSEDEQLDQHELQGQQANVKRRRWKRFVAAIPLMPLATAYIVLRLGWDVFELLVFCIIDMARDTATNSLLIAQALVTHALDYSSELAERLELGRRTQAAVIAVIEHTVIWLFNVAFPAIGDAVTQCGQWAVQLVTWWAETGGPIARDTIEAVVLRGLVPGLRSSVDALASAYARAVWLGGRAIEAVRVLGTDLMRDVRIVFGWTRIGLRWVVSRERWWLNPALWRAAAARVAPALAWLQWAYVLAVGRAIPWCADGLANALCAAYFNALLPSVQWCIAAADWLVQVASGGFVLVLGALQAGYAKCVRLAVFVASICGRLQTPLVRFVGSAWQLLVKYRLILVCGWTALLEAVRRQSWIFTACLAAYSHVRNTALLPAIRATAVSGRFLWQQVLVPFALTLHDWLLLFVVPHVKSFGKYLVTRVHTLLARQRVTAVLAALWRRSQRLILLEWQVIASSAFAGHVKTAMGDTLGILKRQLDALGIMMWPLLQRGWSDGVQAMADVYRQLVAIVDLTAAMVGDLIVDYARRNTVHTSSTPNHPATEAKHTAATTKK
ncbi:hypothetical protein LPJ66_001890 [Kickxella alabastrina]|uniref:Uncharacterized protein n=1 Tax=Kickxella alabastrina TaxID=61397 RepID=A0ACC1IS25_9FUNG|nr:hypothetical protein LPJ66_001890 [Kickxella alabastrina]